MDLLTKTILIGALLGLVLPIIGFILVLRKQAFMSEAIAHIAINGVVLAYILGIHPLFLTASIGSLTGILLEKNRQKAFLNSDSILAMILVGGLSLSIILLSIFSDLRVSLIGLFFGNILLTTQTDIILILVISILVGVFLFANYKALYNSTFDPEYSQLNNTHNKLLTYAFAILVGIVIGASIQILGALLIGGILVIPANIALLFKQGFKRSLILTIIIAQITILIGILISFVFNLPTGASIVLVCIAAYIIARSGLSLIRK